MKKSKSKTGTTKPTERGLPELASAVAQANEKREREAAAKVKESLKKIREASREGQGVEWGDE